MKVSALIGSAMFLLMTPTPFDGIAQKLAIENTYQITKDSKKGYLDDVQYDPKTQITELSFVTRSTSTNKKSKVNYQNYYFDKDYKFIKVDEETDVNYNDPSNRHRNKKYKGDDYTVEGVTMQNNLVGTFVLKKKLITYTWSWLFGGYNKKIKLLEKVKPKDDLGNKYTLTRKFDNDESGEVLAMVQAKGKNANMNEYLMMMIDKDLNIRVSDVGTFDSPQAIVKVTLIPMATDEEADDEEGDEEEGGEESGEPDDEQGNLNTSDIAIVFASSSAGKKADADEHSYTYWRVSRNGLITEKVPFKVAASVWSINQAIYSNGDVYLMGPANEGKYYDQQINNTKKWKFYQLAKISNKKAAYVSTTDLDEFDAKLKTPPSQKRSPSYDGKRFYLSFADLLPNGSIVIAGQNYEWVTVNKQKRKDYRDVIMFHFDNMGKLKSQYGVRREENQKSARYAAAVQKGTLGKAGYYWTIFEMDGFRDEKEGDRKVKKVLFYPSVARVDVDSGNIGDFVQFGLVKDKPTYYLHNRFPILRIPTENSIVYLGVDKPGKVLWFGKVVMD